MKKIILLLSLLLATYAIAITRLETPIQFNGIEPYSISINIQGKFATIAFTPVAIDTNGVIVGRGPMQSPANIPPGILIPVSCMTVNELGMSATNTFAEVLYKAILEVTGLPSGSSTLDWPHRVAVADTNEVKYWEWDGDQSNLVTDTVISNYYVYRQ